MNDEQVLNPEAIEALRAVSPDDGGKFLTELIDIFLADTPPRLAEIDEGIAAGDAHAIVRAAHSIKGSAGNFGAERLARVAQEIEQAGKQTNVAFAKDCVPAIRAAYAATEAALKALRAS